MIKKLCAIIAFSVVLTPLVFGQTQSAQHVLRSPDDLRTHALNEFILGCPTVWDETIVLPVSEVGQTVAFARRSGENWYVAAITLKEQSNINLGLDFLGRGSYECRMASDTPNDQYASDIKTRTVNGQNKLSVSMREEGGFVAKFTKLKK